MPPESPVRLPDLSRIWFARLLSDLGFQRGAEIGVNEGYYSRILCLANPDLRLSSVDVWNHEEAYMEAIRKLRPYRCELIRLKSGTASALFEDGSLDFVYIDDDHTLQGVHTSLAAFVPKVRSGGIVSGHDYKISDVTPAARRCKVVQAVDEFVAANRISPFFVIGENCNGGDWPSWFFVKE